MHLLTRIASGRIALCWAMIGVSALLAGCESFTDPNDLPFEEKLVIRGILDAGKLIDSIQIQRTLPFTTGLPEYVLPSDSLPSFVPDAVAVLSWPGHAQRLRYTHNGLFTSDSIIAEPGVSYRLTTDWNGHHAVATTTVPFFPSIDSIIPSVDTFHIVDNGSLTTAYGISLELSLRPGAGSAYGLFATFRGPSPSGTIILVYCAVDSNSGTTDRVRTTAFGMIGSTPPFIDSALVGSTFGLISYDRAYYDYYETRPSYQSNFGPTGPTTTGHSEHDATKWNVTGDGIGLFIGRALTLKHY